MKNTIELQNTLPIKEQRENLLKLNPDLLYGVYNVLDNWEKNWIVDFELIEDTLTCYPNQLENIKWLEENKDILIINLWELRKGNFEIIAGEKNPDIKFFRKDWSFKIKLDDWYNMQVKRNLVLLSNWVIEIVKSKSKNAKNLHIPTTLRDGWAADENQRTSVAWRNYTDNLIWDLETEYSEESPFLWKKEDWKYYLFTPKRRNKEKAIADLENSVKIFLDRKYNLNNEKQEDLEQIKKFERNFKWIKYEELWDILKDIIENKRIDFFKNKSLDNFEGLENDIKKVRTLDKKWNIISKWNFFIYFDEKNNTYEYRSLREISLPKWIKPTNRLFLESQNQWSKNSRLENLAKENLVPTMKYFAEKTTDILK